MQTNRADALAELQSLCQSGIAPCLTDAEVGAILDRYAVGAVWTPNADFPAGAVIVPTALNGRLYVALQSLTTGDTEPDWPEPGGWPLGGFRDVSDGEGAWRYIGIAPASLWDIGGAARACWLEKAAKAVPAVDHTTGKLTAKNSQIYDHCVAMSARYSSTLIA